MVATRDGHATRQQASEHAKRGSKAGGVQHRVRRLSGRRFNSTKQEFGAVARRAANAAIDVPTRSLLRARVGGAQRDRR